MLTYPKLSKYSNNSHLRQKIGEAADTTIKNRLFAVSSFIKFHHANDFQTFSRKPRFRSDYKLNATENPDFIKDKAFTINKASVY